MRAEWLLYGMRSLIRRRRRLYPTLLSISIGMMLVAVSYTHLEYWDLLRSSMSLAAGYSFLVFNLLCAPCFAAIGAIKREMNNTRWTLIAVGYQTVFAYAVSLCVYQLSLIHIYAR